MPLESISVSTEGQVWRLGTRVLGDVGDDGKHEVGEVGILEEEEVVL